MQLFLESDSTAYQKIKHSSLMQLLHAILFLLCHRVHLDLLALLVLLELVDLL